MSHFSALIENNDIETITLANKICTEFGMDSISAASTLACYQEINNTRLKTDEILSLLTEIGNNQGKGAELSQGSYRYALQNGKPEASMSIKRLELPAFDPRGAFGLSLAYAVSTMGGCYSRANPVSHEILRKPVLTDRFTFSDKARIIYLSENTNACIDSLIACRLIFYAASMEEYAKVFNAVTGDERTALDLIKVGERIYYNDRIMNAKCGFTKADEDLPSRFFNCDGSSSTNIKIKSLVRDEFISARAKYYNIRGLDNNGLPLKEKAEELELIWMN